MAIKKAVLVCIDGWGLREDTYGNAIAQAKTPVMSGLMKDACFCPVDASGLSVGLPEGVMGNSEVGHLTIGAGQAQFQDLVRVNQALKNGTFRTQKAMVDAMMAAKNGTGLLHLAGLVSDGGVHSHQEHLYEILRTAKEIGVPHTYIHCIMDGRDTPPKSGSGYLKQLEDKIAEIGHGTISTVVGRYWAMDRDKRWERVQKAFDVICRDPNEGEVIAKPVAELERRYALETPETDEFILPYVCDPAGGVADGDSFLFFNYRSDRVREICECMGVEMAFESAKARKPCLVTTFTQYKSGWDHIPQVYPPQIMRNGLSEWVAKKGLKQYHCAETEKYAHITFFFNGGNEAVFDNEDRQMIPSPKVPTYDLQPEMSAAAVGDDMAKTILEQKYEFMMCNFAPPDMVGHTGVLDAAIKGVEATDTAIGVMLEACKSAGYALFITSDHGNAEVMLTEDGLPVTSHTTNFVPFIGFDPDGKFKWNRSTGQLSDVAPTMLTYMGLDIPEDMKGKSFI